MEKEVSHTIEIAVALTAMAIVIGIIFFTVTIGGGLRADSHEFGTEVKTTVEFSGLDELVASKETIMPASTAYSLIRRYSNSISEYYCGYCDRANSFTGVEDAEYTNLSTTDNLCLATHLKGKVNLKANKNGEGNYCIYIHSINCPVTENTVCTCDDYPHEASCPGTGNCTCQFAAHSPECKCAHRYDCRTGNGCGYSYNHNSMWGE